MTPQPRAVPRFRLADDARHAAAGSTAAVTTGVLCWGRSGFASCHWLASGLWRGGDARRTVVAYGRSRRSRLPSYGEAPYG
jgi:hypothetical protein